MFDRENDSDQVGQHTALIWVGIYLNNGSECGRIQELINKTRGKQLLGKTIEILKGSDNSVFGYGVKVRTDVLTKDMPYESDIEEAMISLFANYCTVPVTIHTYQRRL